MAAWLLLAYKVASEPSKRRVYVWRKLKRLGALLVNDAVWVLPANSHTREQFQWLAAEIVEMEGNAVVWESSRVVAGDENALVAQFVAQVDEGYRSLLAELERADADIAALSRQYQQLQAQDYFQSELGQQARVALLEARGGPDA